MTTASPPQNLNSMDKIEVSGESDLNTRAEPSTNKPEGDSELIDLVDEVNDGENESVDIMDDNIHYVKDVNDETGQVVDDEPLIEWDDVELLFLKTSYDKLHLADIKYAPSEEKVNSLLDIVMLKEERDWLKEELVNMDGQCVHEKHVKLMHSEFCKERGFVDMKCQEIKELGFKLQKLNISVQKEELKYESKTESLGLLEDNISELKTKISRTKGINTQIQNNFNEDSKRLQSLEGEIDASRSKYVKLKADMNKMKVELEKVKAVEKQELPQLKMKHKSIDELKLRLSEVNERYCQQMGKKETISMRLKCSEVEQKNAIVNQIQYERDKEKVAALLSIAIAHYNSEQQNVKEIQSQYHNLMVIKANMPRNDKRMKEQRRKLIEEIERIKQNIIQENKAASHDTELLKAMVKEVSIVQSMVPGAPPTASLVSTRSILSARPLSEKCDH
uniref:DUF4201 domain-containing protein n=1 Tax=Timema cristinae TaxID=61476 RepID=A0A7R9CT84_TIMCR|nr:unnamed protein product [Timema cristinae]